MNTAAAKKKLTGSKSKATKGQKHVRHNIKNDASTAQKESYVRNKIRRLNEALDGDPVDIELLRKMMVTSEGCVTNDIRAKVWPKLLNVDIFNQPKKKRADLELKEFKANKWWHQVNLDVDRAHRRLPIGAKLTRKRVLQQQLTNIIMRVLCRNPELHYYQGYHDIAVTFLRVVGEDLSFCLLEQLSINHIRDFLDKNMARTNQMLSLFYAVLGKVDQQLERFLLSADVGTVFALSWLITWFGHDVNSFETIVRLCDFFLATHPVMPMYVAVVLVKSNKSLILEEDCDMPMVHRCLCRLPAYIDIDSVDDIIKQSHELYLQHPPTTLKREVRRYLRESDSITHHAELLYQSYNQKPDRILRKRKKFSKLYPETMLHKISEHDDSFESGTELSLVSKSQQTNPIVKVAVWTMTLSMGVMTFLVLNTGKYWM